MTGRNGRILLFAAALLAAGCGEGPASQSGGEGGGPQAAGMRRPADLEGPHDAAVLTIEGMGEIRVELLPEVAPGSVATFRKLAEAGRYDGTTFHRVIPGFMIQGGSPSSRNPDPRKHGRGGLAKFPDEFSDVTHARGAVALANQGRADTAAGQFYIVHQDSPHLDGKHTVFGRVASGMEVVDAITELELDTYGRYGPPNRPYPRDARIVSIRIEPSTAR